MTSLESKSRKSTISKDSHHLEIDQKAAMRKFRKRQRSISDKTIDSELKIPGTSLPSKSNRPRNKYRIKRPMNAFMLFGRAYRPGMVQMFPKVPNTQISIYLGNMWHSMTSEQQKPFYEEAKRIRHTHQHDYPELSDEMDNQRSVKYIKKLREEYKGPREIFIPEEDKTHIQLSPSIFMCAQADQCMSTNTNGEQEATDFIPEVAAATESIVPVQDGNNEMINEGDFQILHATPSEQDITHQNNLNFTGTTFPSKSNGPRKKHSTIKRPMNAFMLFGRAYRPGMVQMFPKVPNTQISTYLGNMWHSMTSEQQKPFYEEAKRIRYRHQHDYPEWSDEIDKQRSIEYIKKLREEYKLPRKIFLPEEDKAHIQLSTSISMCAQADQCISMNTNGMQEAADLISEVAAASESIVPIQGSNGETFNDDDFQILHATPWGQDVTHQNNVDFNDCYAEESFSQEELDNYQSQNQSMTTTTATNMHLGDQTSLPMNLQGLWDLIEISTASSIAQIAANSTDCHAEESLSPEELDNYQSQNQPITTTTETNMHAPVTTQLGDQTSLPVDLQGLWDFIQSSTAPSSTQIATNSTDCHAEESLSQVELGNYQSQNQPMTMTTTVTNMHPPVTSQLGDQTSLPMDLQGLWDLVEISTTPPLTQISANSTDCHTEESLSPEELDNYQSQNQPMTMTTEANMHAPVASQLGDQTSLPMDLQGLWDFIEISTAPPSTQIAANSTDCDSYSWSDVPCENVLDSSMVPMSSVECTVGPTPWLNLDDTQCHLLQNYHSMEPFQEPSIEPVIADNLETLNVTDCDSYTWSDVQCENDFDSSIVPRDSVECTVCTTSWLNLDDDTQCHLLQDYHSMEHFQEKSVLPVVADKPETLKGRYSPIQIISNSRNKNKSKNGVQRSP